MSVPISSLYTYMFAGLCAFLADVASQAGDADSYRAPGLTSGSWTEPGGPCMHTTVHSHFKEHCEVSMALG